MRDVIPTLPFTVDCFRVTDLNTDVVELVLRDVPLAASELDVCRAVHSWAQEFFGMDSDDDPDDGTSSDNLFLLPQDDQRILQYIDLRCVNPNDIREVRPAPAPLVHVYHAFVCAAAARPRAAVACIS